MDRLANALYDQFSDPTRPENILKRPARRTCVSCGSVYKSMYTLLADPYHGCCSDDCIDDIRAIVNTFGSDL